MHEMARRTRSWLRSTLRPRSVPTGPALSFGLVGAAGWIARVHLQALRGLGHQVVVAIDPSDAGIAILDDLFPDAHFLRSEAELETYLSDAPSPPIRYLSVCSPDFLHRPHIELALRCGVDAICEKPLVMDPADLDALEELEKATGRSIHPIMQHRYNPAVLELARRVARRGASDRAEIEVTYVAHRGPWYPASWRGREDQAAGLAMDIGIHFFDLLTWLFGPVRESVVHLREPRAFGGRVELEGASVRWFLSIDRGDLPPEIAARGIRNLRVLRIDGRDVELSRGMKKNLHDEAYRQIVVGQGLRISDVRPGLELADSIQRANLCGDLSGAHALTLARSARDHASPG